MNTLPVFPTPLEETYGKGIPTFSCFWLHGLGASPQHFFGVPPALCLPASWSGRFIYPAAPPRAVTLNQGYIMPAWYDIYSLQRQGPEDETGLLQSETFLRQLIDAEIQRGIPAERIVLIGFSQGGATALYTGLRYPQRLAGIAALSSYLPCRHTLTSVNTNTPIFMAHGQLDPVVPYPFGRASGDQLTQWGCAMTWKEYSMQHQVSETELQDLGQWLQGLW